MDYQVAPPADTAAKVARFVGNVAARLPVHDPIHTASNAAVIVRGTTDLDVKAFTTTRE